MDEPLKPGSIVEVKKGEPFPGNIIWVQTAHFRRISPNVLLPSLAYPGSAAFDIAAFDENTTGRANRIVIPAHSASRPIKTGLFVRPPQGHLVLVCSRSGLATKGIFVANAPGVVDPDYTGELKVILYNGSFNTHIVISGDRIAQLLFVPFIVPQWTEVETLPTTDRGDAGFGSSGS